MNLTPAQIDAAVAAQATVWRAYASGRLSDEVGDALLTPDALRALLVPEAGELRPMSEFVKENRKDALVRVALGNRYACRYFVARWLDADEGWSLFPGYGGVPDSELEGWIDFAPTSPSNPEKTV